MTRDEIIRELFNPHVTRYVPSHEDLFCQIKRIAQIAERAEREKCAKVCEDIGGADAWDCATAIRARGEK
jgi:hypothetical protein